MNGYVYLARSGDNVIYVGSTKQVTQRLREHRRDSRWWTDALDVEVEEYPSMKLARAAERRLIRTEHPFHNVTNKRLRRGCNCPSCRQARAWHDRWLETREAV